jgi:hypothetical protein
MEREALKLALEALKEISRHATTPWEDEWCGELADETLTAINALAQPAQERNFCSRCGTRTKDMTTIHTCTPPQEKTMPLKPHPTDPDKMVYASRQYDIPQLQGVTTAQPAQEPVGYVYSEAGVKHGAIQRDLPNGTPLYTNPPQRPWVDLTEEQIADYLGDEYHDMCESELEFFRLGEAAAKEKNNG